MKAWIRFPGMIFLLLFSGSISYLTSQHMENQLQKYMTITADGFDEKQALKTVSYFQTKWRHAGNRDFDACMDYIADRLQHNAFSAKDTHFKLIKRDTQVAGTNTWQPLKASLQVKGQRDTLLHSLESVKMFLCRNSAPTVPEGVIAELVDIDKMQNITPGALDGKIALTAKRIRQVYKNAIVKGTAAGIISSWLPNYNQAEKHPHSISMSRMPTSKTSSAFGFKISLSSKRYLDKLLAQGPTKVHATIQADIYPKSVREITAEITGSSKPEESIVLIAHVDEPGANDNASGSAALLEIAINIQKNIQAGRLQQPARTLKFMWVEEIATVRRWHKNSPADFERIKTAFVLDMVGQDISKTGGTFLIERMPDPAAIWLRPPDKHSEWGASKVSKEQLKGSYLNDLFLASCMIRSAKNGWPVATNPFEGGSDHVPFLQNKVPAVLAWHFTDAFYHTSGDEIDKVSSAEMANVAAAITAASLFVANCTNTDALALLDIVDKQAKWRLENEISNSRKILKKSNQPEKIAAEVEILQAWQAWYMEAFDSIKTVPIIQATTELATEIKKRQQNLKNITSAGILALKNSKQP